MEPIFPGSVGVHYFRNTPDSFKAVSTFQTSQNSDDLIRVLIACNVATDLTLTILPAYVFGGLQMSIKTKLGLISLMCLSIFAFVAALVKVILIKSLSDRFDYTCPQLPPQS